MKCGIIASREERVTAPWETKMPLSFGRGVEMQGRFPVLRDS